MASETIQETPSQQLVIGNNGDSSVFVAHSSLSPNALGGKQIMSPNGNSNGGAPLSAVLDDGGEEELTHREPLFTDTENTSNHDDNDDVNSKSVASPSSITSPPYWVQVHPSHPSGVRGPQGRHNRAVSNVSVDSILPPDAITLQDNERDEDDEDQIRRPWSRSNALGRDKNKACWAKSVQVTDSVLVNGSATNIGAFVVWNIRVETLNGSYMNIRKRYSEFDDLRRRLIQTFPNFEAAVPVLPPKSVISKFRLKFLEKRRAGLQYFLNCILLNPEFSGSPVLKEFLFD